MDLGECNVSFNRRSTVPFDVRDTRRGFQDDLWEVDGGECSSPLAFPQCLDVDFTNECAEYVSPPAQRRTSGEEASPRSNSHVEPCDTITAMPPQPTSMLSMGQILAKLDPIRRQLRVSLRDWHPPEFVLLGAAESGATALLERWVGTASLRASCPVHLCLRTGKAPQLLVKVQCETDEIFCQVPEIMDLGASVEVACHTAQECGPGADVVLCISGPNIPDLDVLSSAANDLAFPTNAAADGHLERGQLLFVAAVPIPQAPSTSATMAFVRAHRLQPLTCGVLTGADRLQGEDRAWLQELLQSPASNRELPHGWVAIAQPDISSDECPAAEAEERIFRRLGLGSLVAERRATLPALVDRMAELYGQHMRSEWVPGTLDRLQREMAAACVSHAALGLPSGICPGQVAGEQDQLALRGSVLHALATGLSAALAAGQERFQRRFVEPLRGVVAQLLRQAPTSDDTGASQPLPAGWVAVEDQVLEMCRASGHESAIFWRQTLREALLTPGPFQLGRFGALAKAVMADVDAVLQAGCQELVDAVSNLLDRYSPDLSLLLSLAEVVTGPASPLRKQPLDPQTLAERISEALRWHSHGALERDLPARWQHTVGRHTDWLESCYAERQKLTERMDAIVLCQGTLRHLARDLFLAPDNQNGKTPEPPLPPTGPPPRPTLQPLKRLSLPPRPLRAAPARPAPEEEEGPGSPRAQLAWLTQRLEAGAEPEAVGCALQRLAALDLSPMPDAAIAHRAVQAVALHMQQSAGVGADRLQAAGCQALARLTGVCPSPATDERAVAAVLAGMAQHLRHAAVQEAGAKALAGWSVHGAWALQILNADGARILLLAMDSHPENVAVQVEGCMTLSNLASQDEAGRMGEAPALPRVLHALEGHPDQPELQRSALAAVANLVAYDEQKAAAVAAGGVAAVVAAMGRGAHCPPILGHGCHALWNLARDDRCQAALAAAGAIPAVIRAMAAHPASLAVQEPGIGALSQLALHVANWVPIAQEGGIAGVVAALGRFMGHVSLVAHGCQALWQLALNDANKILIAEAQGLQQIVRAMAHHPGARDVQIHGLRALWNLALADGNKPRLAAAGAIEAVAAAMGAFPLSVDVQEAGCGALSHLALEAANHRRIGEAGGVAALLLTMEQYQSNAEVQAKGSKALWHLAANGANRQQIQRAGGAQLLLRAMERHHYHVEVQAKGCRALGQLAQAMDVLPLIAAANGVRVAVAAMERYQSHQELQEAGLALLCLLVRHPPSREALLPTEGVRAALRVMERQRMDAVIQEVGCQFLCNVASDARGAQRVAEAKGIGLVLLAMERHPFHLPAQEWGCRALAALAGALPGCLPVASARGLRAVVRAMERHPGSAGVQEAGCSALALAGPGRPAEAKALRAAVAAMRVLPRERAVQLAALRALLAALTAPDADPDRGRRRLMEAEGGPVVLAAMAQHPDCPELQDLGRRALACLVGPPSPAPPPLPHPLPVVVQAPRPPMPPGPARGLAPPIIVAPPHAPPPVFSAAGRPPLPPPGPFFGHPVPGGLHFASPGPLPSPYGPPMGPLSALPRGPPPFGYGR